MCAVIQHILKREPAARSRFIPPACGARFGIEPWRTSETDRRFITRNGWPLHRHKREPPRSPLNPMDGRDFRSPPCPPCPHQLSDFRAGGSQGVVLIHTLAPKTAPRVTIEMAKLRAQAILKCWLRLSPRIYSVTSESEVHTAVSDTKSINDAS
jgi:hypothetical protein